MIEELGLHPGTAGYRGLELLNVNLYLFNKKKKYIYLCIYIKFLIMYHGYN